MNIASFYRFKFFNLEGVNKILYLDSDVIVRKDLHDLYKTDMETYSLAGVKDILHRSLKSRYNLPPNAIYINAGLLLIDVKKTKETNINQGIKNFVELYRHIPYSDQDIINYIFLLYLL